MNFWEFLDRNMPTVAIVVIFFFLMVGLPLVIGFSSPC